NQLLSEQRAKAVVDYLASKFGVDRSRVEAVGMGQEHPIVITGPNVPEMRNRRVTVVNIGT
ncbi:MAG TPA: OmpA family protein, partial [Acetobacteraceae bacterium]|nr:OmpA family protein [Acetobacteraceae bacterium]